MILIFSSQEDYSTNEVLKWLKYFNHSFKRLNDIDIYKLNQRIQIDSNTTELILQINDKKFNIKKIHSIWVRRGGFNFSLPKIKNKINGTMIIKQHVASESMSLIKYVNARFDEKNTLGSLNKFSINKLISLEIAKSLGLEIPETIITTNKKDLQNFINKHKQVITKNIQDVLIIENENNLSYSYTELVTKDFIIKTPDTFPPSLFQKKIDKLFEIRSFFLDNKFYSMAIFSQTDPKTKIDFRKYNYDTPNRISPFNLPNNIQNKLKKFMNKVGLNTGSFDLIYDKNKRYIFLEINPIGQYEIVSHLCNYNINKKIALHLINSSKNEEKTN